MPDYAFESAALSRGARLVAGVDEVGRGPLAGPVTAAAVILDPRDIPDGLNDSKQLTASRREALAVRRERSRLLGARRFADEDPEPLDLLPSELPTPAERAERRERVAISAAALALLKPQERRALVLKAEGYSYREIMDITGWTYTKVNRCMAEGRKAFLEHFGRIEAGKGR